jgi:hypothetical protein
MENHLKVSPFRNIFSHLWIFIVMIAFTFVYARSLTFVYIDGDDASTIAYHLMGRNKDLQPAYSAYQGMMDKMLSYLPQEEDLLRRISMLITGIAGIFMVILILILVFEWVDCENAPPKKMLITVITLLAAPELFFFGLVYSPTLVALCLLLTAHLILRRVFRSPNWLDFADKKQITYIILSLLLFGFGVSFRWNTILYMFVIAVDLILLQSDISKPLLPQLKKRIGFGFSWLFLALMTSIIMIFISGYGYADFIDTFGIIAFVVNQSGSISTGTGTPFKEVILNAALTLSPMFTPAFGLITMTGFVAFVRRRDPLILVILVGILSALPFAKSGVPKFIITSLPIFVLCFVQGIITLWGRIGQNWVKLTVNLMLFLLLLTPWMLGIRVVRGGTAYGPGFEIRPYDYVDFIGPMQFSVILDSGAAFPTPEGQRPLYGYAYALIGGDWRQFMLKKDAERTADIQYAILLGCPIVITNWSPDYYLNKLYAMGFKTNDPYYPDEHYFTQRDFMNLEHQSVTLLIHEIEEDNANDFVAHLFDPIIKSDKIVITGYPSVMRYFYSHYPEAMESIGPVSALVELDRLR